MIRFDSTIYAPLVIGALYVWPICWAIRYPSIQSVSLTLLVVYSVSAALYFCHVDGLSLSEALGRLSSRYASGCANLTIIYIWLVVLYYFAYAVYFAAHGMHKGRDYSRERWVKFYNSKFK